LEGEEKLLRPLEALLQPGPDELCRRLLHH